MFSICLLIFIVFYILCRLSVLHEEYSTFKKCTERGGGGGVEGEGVGGLHEVNYIFLVTHV